MKANCLQNLFRRTMSNLWGEMIALQALCTVKKFDMKVADRLYIGLIKGLVSHKRDKLYRVR